MEAIASAESSSIPSTRAFFTVPPACIFLPMVIRRLYAASRALSFFSLVARTASGRMFGITCSD
jgi:hypothetical protein